MGPGKRAVVGRMEQCVKVPMGWGEAWGSPGGKEHVLKYFTGDKCFRKPCALNIFGPGLGQVRLEMRAHLKHTQAPCAD